MQAMRNQRGVSFFGVLLIVVLVGFFVSIAFKLVPHYIDNKSLEQGILAVERDSMMGDKVQSVVEFYDHMSKTIQVNSIPDLAVQDIMQITQSGDQFLVRLKYEKREPLIKNIDLVVTFDKEYSVRAQ